MIFFRTFGNLAKRGLVKFYATFSLTFIMVWMNVNDLEAIGMLDKLVAN